LHSESADTEQERNIQLELAKRILQKLGIPVGNPQLASNHKQLLMIVYEKHGDLSNLVESAKIFTSFDSSDDKKIMLKSLIEMKDYSKALEMAEKLMKSSASIDFEAWRMICAIPDCQEFVSSTIIPILETLHSSDVRGVKLAKIHFDSRFSLSDNPYFSQNLLNYAIEMRSKGSMVFDVIQVLSELNYELIFSFASLLQLHFESVSVYNSLLLLNFL
jgi:hypothetical protein